MIIQRMILVIVLLLPFSPATFSQEGSADITIPELREHIRYLASDELQGRLSGEDGNRLAADYLAKQFASYGLTAVGDDGTYFQNFTFFSRVRIAPDNQLSVTTPAGTIHYVQGETFRPMSFSTDTTVIAPLVFVGYGITSDTLHYDDYAGVDVRGKIVVVLRYSPEGRRGDGPFTRYSPVRMKAFNARDKGAAGIILISGPLDDEEAELIPFTFDRASGSSGIAAITMRWTQFDSLLRTSGRDLRTVQQTINTEKQPRSFVLENCTATLRTRLEKLQAKSANVVGLLKGSDPSLRDEVVIIGAHFDHLGTGGEGSGSMKPDTQAVHHGADDNASGTAGLLELAEYLAAHRSTVKRSVLFIGFSGEELGLLGSDYYVKQPIIPLERTIAMMNMDMIGRMKENVLVVEGMGTSSVWEIIVRSNNPDSALTLKLKPDGFGPSDHASFYGRDLPVLFFFTNIHEDYHRPSDTWDRINYEGEERVVEFVARIAMDVANRPERPSFTKVIAAAGPGGGDRGGYRATLGIIPDFAEDVEGLKIAGTRPAGPAEKVGLLTGDIIVKFAGKDIKNIYDYMYMLGEFKAGDEVSVVIRRGMDEKSFTVRLEERKR